MGACCKLEKYTGDGTTEFQYMNNDNTEFRTGQDEIKKIVRNMLDQRTNSGYESQQKLNEILSILQDINVMDKGNIEEKINFDDELDPDTKGFLVQTLLSKHTTFNIHPSIDEDINTHKNDITENENEINEYENMEQKYEQKDMNEYEFDICKIIEERQKEITYTENNYLMNKLIHISPTIDKISKNIMDLNSCINTMELDRLTGTPLLHSSLCIFLKYDFGNKLNISLDTFYNFILFIEKGYHLEINNPYHNRMHATEVMLSTMIFINCLEESVGNMISILQIFTAFISAIIHDVDHPGNTNAFEINTESELSILYSDQSVLEYHHLQYTFNALKKYKKKMDFTIKWDKTMQKEFRKQTIYSVLATDLSKHFDTIAHVKQLKIIKETDLKYIFESIIKMSDLSHVIKPLDQHKKWTQRITKEFHNQGDREVTLGLDVSPFCNKQNKKIAKGQLGFIKHIIFPLYNVAQRFFTKNGKYEIIINQLNSNRKYWETEAKKEESSVDKIYKSKSRQILISRTKTTIAILTNLENTPPPILPSSVSVRNSNKNINRSKTIR